MNKILKQEEKRDQFYEAREKFIDLIHRFNTNIELLEKWLIN